MLSNPNPLDTILIPITTIPSLQPNPLPNFLSLPNQSTHHLLPPSFPETNPLNISSHTHSSHHNKSSNRSRNPSTAMQQTITSQFQQILADNQSNLNQNLSINLSSNRVNLSQNKRNTVVNWVALIHTKYWFQQETLHLAVSINDRYLDVAEKEDKQGIDYELVALTSFWMASKIEQKKIKELKVWIKLGRGFVKEEILEMEEKILVSLDYNLIQYTSQYILWELILEQLKLNQKQIHFCFYLLELSLLDNKFTKKFDSIIIALSCVYVCLKIFGIDNQNLHQHQFSDINNIILLNYQHIRLCSKKLSMTLQRQSKNMKSPIVRKYTSKKLNSVSQMTFGRKSDTKIITSMTTIGDQTNNKIF